MPAKVEDADERIRACTLAEIEKNGIVGLRVANIAKQAGVSVPLVYKLFGDREQLLATVLSESIETFYLTDINNIRALVEKSKTNITIELLLQALPMPSDAFRLKQRKLRMLIFAASYESPKLRKAVGKAQQTIQHATRDLIHLVRERSGSKVDVDEDVIAFAVQAFGFSFSIHDINPDKPLNWKRMSQVNGAYGCLGDLGMHVLHVPLRLGWKPSRVSADLVKRVSQRPDGKGAMVACDTWDNATIHAHVPHALGDFPMTLKTWRIAPGEANSWSLKVLGMHGSASFSTKTPRQWSFMRYTAGGPQAWSTEDLGYTPLFPTITGGIFEFGFTDAILQMWAAFLDEMTGGDAKGFGCATPAEAADHHAVLTAALQAGVEGRTVAVDYT